MLGLSLYEAEGVVVSVAIVAFLTIAAWRLVRARRSWRLDLHHHYDDDDDDRDP